MTKKRLDVILFERGHFESREKAKAFIMMGKVYINNQKVDKAGTIINEDTPVEVRNTDKIYVSRGGYKLKRGLDFFNLDVSGLVALDVGASTGGFTDCLLQCGVRKVYSIDVGYGELNWKLRTDDRVVCMEKCNIRHVAVSDFPGDVGVAVIDVSFISLKLVIPKVVEILQVDSFIICLIKPQFEAGRNNVGKNGVVRDPNVHKNVLREFINFVSGINLNVLGITHSPIKGPKGNIEFLAHLSSGGELYKDLDIEDIVNSAHKELNNCGDV